MIKKLLAAGFAVVLLAGVASAQYSGPITSEINITAAASIGCSVGGVDTLNVAKSSAIFTIPPTSNPAGYFLSVYMRDTVASAVVDADTLFVRLVRAPDGITSDLDSAQSAIKGGGWIPVYTFASTRCVAANWPIYKAIPLDSVCVYPIGPGVYKWMVFGGKAQANHYPGKAYKLTAVVECAERH